MDHIYPKTLFIVYLIIFSWSSLFVDCVFANSPTLLKGICNLKNQHSQFFLHHSQNSKKIELAGCMFPAEVELVVLCLLVPALLPHTVFFGWPMSCQVFCFFVGNLAV